MSDMHVCPRCGLEYAGEVLMKLRAERDALRELLRELRNAVHCADVGDWDLLDRIDAALAAKGRG